MASFEFELPTEIMRDIQQIYDNADDIFGAMTKAGAEVVMRNIRANAPAGVRDSDMMNCLKMTRTYRASGGNTIATKVAFYGYFVNEDGRTTPAPLVGNVFEYGRSGNKFPKRPFLRKSFRKEDIENAMREAQRKASGGLLTDDE